MILAQVVFVTRLLGLINGQQPLHVQAAANVHSVQIVIDGNRILTLDKLPARTVINFGTELTPREVTAIAFDASGTELGRDTQYVNLARPVAEAAIVLERDSGGLRATVKWEHNAAGKPRRIGLKLNGKKIESGAKLPPLDLNAIHVLQAEVVFRDGATATKELVFGGQYAEQMPTELTAVLTHTEGDCFQLGGETVRARAVEKPESVVHFVRGSNPRRAYALLPVLGQGSRNRGVRTSSRFAIDDAQLRIVWPTARAVPRSELGAVTDLFTRSPFLPGKVGTRNILTMTGPNASGERYTDAVAVAGVQSLAGAKRRAVVLVLTGEPDESKLAPGVVRRYLDRIGVPLRVWSLVEVTQKIKDDWDEVTDIGKIDRLERATEDLRAELDSQRIAWLAISPADVQNVRPCEAP